MSFSVQAQNYVRPFPGHGYRPVPLPLPVPAPIYPQPYPVPYPQPYPGPSYPVPYPAPYPQYPQPIVVQPYVITCNTVGLVNGLIYYGIGNDIYTATQRSFFVCQSVGQVCRLVECH